MPPRQWLISLRRRVHPEHGSAASLVSDRDHGTLRSRVTGAERGEILWTPPPDVRAELSVQDAGHLIRLASASPFGGQWLEVLKSA